MLIYFVGFMGSGKTTAGKKLARKFAYDFIDLDEFIESETGLAISEYFKRFGEDKFRQTEQKALRKTFGLKNTVVSTGGGAPCFFNNMDEINKNGTSIYLKAETGLIISRLQGEKNQRPLIKDKNEEEFREYVRRLLADREEYYNSAKIIVGAKNLDIEQLKSKIIDFSPLG